MESVFTGMLGDVPLSEGPMEKALHSKRRRFLPPQRPIGDVSLWSTELATTDDMPVNVARQLDERVETDGSEIGANDLPSCSTPPSPALFMECGGSPQSQNSTPRSQLSPQPGGSGLARKRPISSGTPLSRRCLNPSTSSASINRRPLTEDEISEQLLCYGSEEDETDSGGEDEIGLPPVLIPRPARVFMMADVQDEEEHDTSIGQDASICLTWPPLLPPNVPVPEGLPSGPELSAPAEHEPYDKFDFKWSGFSSSQTPPQLRREPFSDNNCGPTVPLASPYEAFTAIWDRKIMEHIAVETNRYAQQLASIMLLDGSMQPNSRITKWCDTNVDELYVYFAIILASGVVVKTRLEEYWNIERDIFITPEFSVAMKYDRYVLLSRCLHFTNSQETDILSMSKSQAKLHKLQPIVDHLNCKFSQLYTLSRNVALDESLTMWKGWLDINQFIHNKAATVGIKTYEVCESQTGYLWRFEIHAGHEASNPQENTPISGLIPSLVLRLLNGLEHRGHTIWMDTFYNSPALARELKVRGFDCVGTLRTNRQFVPVELKELSKQNMVLGQVCGCTSGDVDLVVWRDKNRVALISTYHGLATVDCNGELKPSIIADYNLCMGGVDLKDSKIAMYPIERRRNRIWYKKLFRRLLNVSVLNAFILLKSQHDMSHRNFRKSLVKQLLAKHKTSTSAPISVETVGHFPARYSHVGGKSHERLRRVCAVCKTRTTSYCKACEVPLCTYTCFEPHHTS